MNLISKDMLTDEMKITVEETTNSRLPDVDFDNLTFGATFSDHMLVSDYDGNNWANTKIVPFGPMSMKPSLVSLHYGQAIFEGMKAYRNEKNEILLFRPEENWKRINKSAARMCMPAIPEEIFIDGLKQLVELDSDWVSGKEGSSLYIRPFMFATDDALGVRPSTTYKFVIITCPVAAFFAEPINLKIETEFSRASEGGVGFAKAAGNYGGAMYPQKLAQEEGYHQVIWTDSNEHKYIEEAGAMNVMFVIGDCLVTAPTGGTILEGITRDSVLRIAKDLNYNIEIRKIEVKEVITAIENGDLKEGFGVGTAATIAPIAGIGYKGTDYDLSQTSDNTMSLEIAAKLNAIRMAEEEDPYGWVVKVC